MLEGDCDIFQHDSNRITVIDVSNVYHDEDTLAEKAVKTSEAREEMRKHTNVPSNKHDYRQKAEPRQSDCYLKENTGTGEIFQFIISNPDMDHIDGVQDLFTEQDLQHFGYKQWRHALGRC